MDPGGCNENICYKEAISNFVKELVKAIKMVAYGEPVIVHFAEHSYDAAGYSLVQLIETSAFLERGIDLPLQSPFQDHNTAVNPSRTNQYHRLG